MIVFSQLLFLRFIQNSHPKRPTKYPHHLTVITPGRMLELLSAIAMHHLQMTLSIAKAPEATL
jgi:hypothetical protein